MFSSFSFLIFCNIFHHVIGVRCDCHISLSSSGKDVRLISVAAEGLRLRDEPKIIAALDNAVKQQSALTAAEIRLIHAHYFFLTVQNRRALEEYEQVAQAAADTETKSFRRWRVWGRLMSISGIVITNG